MERTVTKQEFKRALEDRKVLIVGTKYTTNGWTEFRVYIIEKSKAGLTPFKQVLVEDAPYFNKKNWSYKCVAWGTDRRLEVILGIGYTLGLKFHEIRQTYEWLQG